MKSEGTKRGFDFAQPDNQNQKTDPEASGET